AADPRDLKLGDVLIRPVVLDGRAQSRHSLSEDEVARAGCFATPLLRARYIAAHVALRQALAEALDLRPEAIIINRRPCQRCGGPHGKPVLAAARDSLSFNLSHSGRFGVIALAR